MSGIESIQNKIEADGIAESEKMLNSAKAEAARIRRENEIKIAELKTQTEIKVVAVRAQKQRIAASNASLAVRKEMLAAKKELIDRVCAEAIKRIGSFDTADYEKAILGLFQKCAVEGGELVLLSVNTEKKLGEGIVDKMNASLPGKKVKLDAPTSEIGDGFILQGDHSRQICTFEAVLDLSRDQIEAQVAKILFG